jgi:outer membrane receptor for ferrienterochelin and colicin
MRRKPLLFVLTALLASTSNTSIGQSTPQFEKMTLEELLNVRITTASRVSQRAGESPATVIVITANQIRSRRYRNLAEVLNDLPDMKVNDKSDPQVFNTFSIRGITRQDKFVILMDGVRISSPVNDQLPVLENFPIYFARQIEVVFGPGSALYGADAMSGVINIITDKTDAGNVLEASLTGGTYGYSDQHLFIKRTLKSGVNLMAAGQFTYDRQPDFSRVYPAEFEMSGQQTGWFNSTYGPIKPAQPIDAAFSAPVKTHNMYVSLYKGGFDFTVLHHYSAVPSSTTLTPQNGVFNKNVFYGQGVTSAHASYTDSIGLLKSVTGVQASFSEVNPNSNFRNVFGRMEHGYKYSYGSMVKMDQQLTLALSEKLQMVGGFAYEIFKALPKSVELSSPQRRGTAVEGRLLNSQEYYNPTGIEAKFYTLAYNNVGSFLQVQYNPLRKLGITLGGRFDHNSRFGSTVNPRLGLVYTHSSKTTVKALYGTAYWAPSPHITYEQYGSFYSLDSGRTYASDFWHLPNPGLKPTTSKTVELSVNQKVNNHLNFTFTGYYTRLYGLISDVPDNGNTNLYNNYFLGYPVTHIEVPVNAGAQTTYGGNVVVNSMFNLGNSRFNAWSSLSWVDGTTMEYAVPAKLTKVEIPLVAPWQFRAGIDGNSGRFSYSLRALRSGIQRLTGFKNADKPYARQTIQGYTLINASASYELKNNFTFFVKGQNLLNQRFKLVIPADVNDSNPSTFYGSLQDPLRVFAGLAIVLR